MQVGVDVAMMLDNKRIFVVERDEIDRAILQFMLHDENETHEVAGLEEAYEKAARSPPDLVLLGRGFAAERGPEIVGEVAAKTGAKVLVIAESAADDLALACVKAGAHSAVIKPLTVEGVRDKVDIALGRKRGGLVSL
jgi:DNA-binding response OmpR family regulator